MIFTDWISIEYKTIDENYFSQRELKSITQLNMY